MQVVSELFGYEKLDLVPIGEAFFFTIKFVKSSLLFFIKQTILFENKRTISFVWGSVQSLRTKIKEGDQHKQLVELRNLS